MKTDNNQLTIVIPVYNEEGCVKAVVENWIDITKKISRAYVLVVDDGSRDATSSILDSMAENSSLVKVVHQVNGGHGRAVVNGYKQAIIDGAEWIFQVDSDNQFDAADFWKLWERRQESPFILGYRKNRHDPWHRKSASKLARLLIYVLFGVKTVDPNIPFRLMRADFLATHLAKMDNNVFAPNIFLSILAKRSNIATLDIPVTHHIRETGVPSLNVSKWLSACTRCTRELLALRRSLSQLKPCSQD